MDTKEIKDLKTAYNTVFDENEQIKSCGRAACMNLINLMKNYTSENVGDEDTGKIEIAMMQAEYHKIIG